MQDEYLYKPAPYDHRILIRSDGLHEIYLMLPEYSEVLDFANFYFKNKSKVKFSIDPYHEMDSDFGIYTNTITIFEPDHKLAENILESDLNFKNLEKKELSFVRNFESDDECEKKYNAIHNDLFLKTQDFAPGVYQSSDMAILIFSNFDEFFKFLSKVKKIFENIKTSNLNFSFFKNAKAEKVTLIIDPAYRLEQDFTNHGAAYPGGIQLDRQILPVKKKTKKIDTAGVLEYYLNLKPKERSNAVHQINLPGFIIYHSSDLNSLEKIRQAWIEFDRDLEVALQKKDLVGVLMISDTKHPHDIAYNILNNFNNNNNEEKKEEEETEKPPEDPNELKNYETLKTDSISEIQSKIADLLQL